MRIVKAVNKLVQNKEKEYLPAESIGPADADTSNLESDVEFTEDDLPLDYPENEEVEDDTVLSGDGKSILTRISKDGETLIDALMNINEDRKFSILIKVLQNAVRLADEFLLTDDTLNKGK